LAAALIELLERESGEDDGKVKKAVETIIFMRVFFHFKIFGEQLGMEAEQPKVIGRREIGVR